MSITEPKHKEKNKEKDTEKDKEKDKKKENLTTTEGFDTNSAALNKVENELIQSAKTMRDDLILFAKWSVVNVFVVWIIWRVGSHMIWYNSIPRILLKSIYPPGYDYLKELLRENEGDGKCADITHTGGVIQEKASYEDDQLEAFNERKACCPGLELPYAEGEDMDVKCFPLNTSKSTIKKMNKLNYNYKVWDDEYKQCVNYVQWKGENEQQAAQAEAQAVQAEIQLEKARQQQGGDGGSQHGGLFGMTARAVNNLNMTEADMKVFDKASGFESSELGTRESNWIGQSHNRRKGIRAVLAQRAADENKANFLQNSDAFDTAAAGYAARAKRATTRLDNQITAAQTALTNATEGAVDVKEYVNPVAEAAEQAKETPEISGQQITPLTAMAMQHPSFSMRKKANVAVEMRKAMDSLGMGSLTEKQLDAMTPQAKAQFLEQLNQEIAKTQVQTEKKRLDIKLSELKKELKEKENDQAVAAKRSIETEKRQKKIEEQHAKVMANLQLRMTKRQKDSMQARINKLQALKEKNLEKQAKFEAKMAEHKKKEDAKLAMDTLKKRDEELAKMERSESKINTESMKATGAAAGGMIKAVGEALWKLVTFLFKALKNLIIGLLYWLGGCSWDQGLQGVITGPNTLTSLSTSFILAIKASISWIIYSCITASGGNILISFLFATIFLCLATALVNIVWISPLSTVWTLFEFKWPQPMMFLSVLGFPILATIYGLIFGILYIFYSWAHVIEFHFNCLFSSKGDKFKSQLKGCTNIQATLRRLFFLLTIINAVQTLDPKVVTGIILCFLYIEFKKK